MPLRGRVACITLVSCSLLAATGAAAETIYGVSAHMGLITFDSAAPGVITSAVALNPVPIDVMAIDFRPATGQLYAVVSLQGPARLATIDPATGTVTPIGSPLNTGITEIAFSFAPVGDVARLITDTGQNLLVDPVTAVATPANSVQGSIVAIAHSPDNTLYGIGHQADALFRIGGVGGSPSPDTGTVTSLGPLGVTIEHRDNSFDISPSSGVAYAALHQETGPTGLYIVNLATGAATLIDLIGPVNAIAVAPPQVSAAESPTLSPWALLALGAAIAAFGLRRLSRGVAGGPSPQG